MKKLFIGNLSWSITEAQLVDYFSQAGKVIMGTIITNRDTGRSRGFGFVEMETEEGATNALTTLNQTYLDGRQIIVKEAQSENKDHSSDRTINDFLYSNAEIGDEIEIQVAKKKFVLVRKE